MPPNHSTAGHKLLVSHVMPIAVLPYTAAAQPGVPAEQHEFLSSEIATLSSTVRSGRPQSAAAPRPAAMQMSSGAATRAFGSGEQAVRMQAVTAALHEDVMLAEARLQRLRAVNSVSVAGASGENGQSRGPSAWQRRALARIGVAVDEPSERAPTGAQAASGAVLGSRVRVERAVP